MVGRLLIFAVFAALTAVSAHLFFGSMLFASAEGQLQEIVLRDTYKNEAHEFSGIVSVPSECHDLSVRAKDLDARTTVLIFESWERPSIAGCSREVAARAIRTVVFAPPETNFRALFDGEWIPLRVVLTQP